MGGDRRVAITGLGVVAPAGIGRDAYWRGLNEPGTNTGRAIEIDGWDPSPYFDSPKQSRRAEYCQSLAQADPHQSCTEHPSLY